MQMMLLMDDGYDKSNDVDHKIQADGNPVGNSNSNTLLEYRVYNVGFVCGPINKDVANIISKNMYAQVDENGREHLLMSDIIHHQSYGSATQRKEELITCGSKMQA